MSWGTSQQIPEPQNALAIEDMRDATLRQLFHLSVGGTALRVHVSNAFGMSALHLSSVHIARPISPADSAIDPATDKALTFAGHADVTIPPGAEMLSDPVEGAVGAMSDVAVSIHYDEPPGRETGHPGSRATSYYVHGDVVSAAKLDAPKKVDHWYQISAIDVLAPGPSAVVVALGDSITDGHGATTNGNDRWTDVLAGRLQALASTQFFGVSNQGIGGNHLLTDGLAQCSRAIRSRCAWAGGGSMAGLYLKG